MIFRRFSIAFVYIACGHYICEQGDLYKEVVRTTAGAYVQPNRVHSERMASKLPACRYSPRMQSASAVTSDSCGKKSPLLDCATCGYLVASRGYTGKRIRRSPATANGRNPMSPISASDIKVNQIHPGPVPGKTVVADNARGIVWCEIIPLIGTPPSITAHIYNSTGVDNCTEERTAHFDAARLAADLKVPKVVLNPGRHWTFDKVTCFTAGETVELQGMRVTWVATMTSEAIASQMGPPYTPGRITRDTEWLYRKGKPAWLLRTPEGKVWVMQVFTKEKDSSLSMDTLDSVGSKLHLPAGWKFEKKVLTEDLSLQPRRADGDAYIMRDDLGNTYMGCGFDKSCNYIP